MADSHNPRKVQDIYIQWKLESAEYKIGEIMGWLMLGLAFVVLFLSFFVKPFYIFWLFIFPASKLNVDWKTEMPILGEIATSLERLKWDSSSKVAFVIALLIMGTQVMIVSLLFLLLFYFT